MQRWYCAQSLPHSERLACEHLKRQAFTHFLPVMDRDEDEKNPPLFPGYLFVQFDRLAQPWRSILGTRGIRTILGLNGDTPNPLPHGCVEELQQRSLAGEFVDRRKTGTQMIFVPGDAVRVSEGPWWGHAGFVDRSDKERVYVLLSLFNRPTRVSVRREWVEKAA